MIKLSIDQLIDSARKIPITEEQRESQRRSFAFGNMSLENDLITREIMSLAASKEQTR